MRWMVYFILSFNNEGLARVTKNSSPCMHQRKSGDVITVGSGSCHHLHAMMSMHSATKSFGHQLSRSLHYEPKKHCVNLVTLMPHFFVSNVHNDKKNSLLTPDPQGVEEYSFPYWFHLIMGMV